MNVGLLVETHEKRHKTDILLTAISSSWGIHAPLSQIAFVSWLHASNSRYALFVIANRQMKYALKPLEPTRKTKTFKTSTTKL